MRNTIHLPRGRRKYTLSVLVLCSIALFFSCSLVTRSSFGQQNSQGNTSTDVPHVISYQGALTSATGQPVPDGKYSVTATLYSDAQGANYVWQDKYDVNVKAGVFSVLLGSGSSHLPRLLTIDQPLWVGVAIGNQAELRPLAPLTSVPYALNVADNSITAKKMATDFVGGITVDNVPMSIKGKTLDLKSGEGIDLNYDQMTNSLSFNLANGLTAGKGTKTQQYIGAVPPCPSTDNNVPTNSIGYASNGIVGTAGGFGYASLLGGWGNMPTGDYSSVVGGTENKATGCGSFVGGGGILQGGCNPVPGCGIFGAFAGNAAIGVSSVVGGGAGNVANFDLTTIGGGQGNSTGSNWSVVGGGLNNIAGVAALGITSTVGGGEANQALGDGAIIGGGEHNTANDKHSAICGGFGNVTQAGATHQFIGGGYQNTANASFTTIGGGNGNKTNNDYDFLGGGRSNIVNGNLSTIGGGDSNTTVNNWNTIGGGHTNITNVDYSTIGGGDSNKTFSQWSTVGGGWGNIAGVVAGVAAGITQTVGGGDHNYANGDGATIAGGEDNKAWSMHDFIGGGRGNETILQGFPCPMGTHNVICGGANNRANGSFSMIPGGLSAQTRDYGQLAHASGSFAGVQGDAQTSVFVLRNTTISGGGFTSLFLDGVAQRISVPANGAMALHILIIGKMGGCGAAILTGGFEVTVYVHDACGAAAVGAINKTNLTPLPAGWNVAVGPGPANNCSALPTVDIRVTSGANGPVDWVASVRSSEVVF